MRRLAERIEAIERDLVRDLDLRNEAGSVVTRMLGAMRELAKEDSKVAAVLKGYSLM